MPDQRPQIIIIAGPNGAGKSSTAPALLQLDLNVTAYVNADAIARGMSAFSPDSVAFEAGRVMLERIRALAAKRANFAFETTLAGRSYAHQIAKWRSDGYEVNLVYIWLSSPDIALRRVAERVSQGGHSIPPETVIERYHASIANLTSLYIPRVSRWMVMDNSIPDVDARLIAEGSQAHSPTIRDSAVWNTILRQSGASL